MAHTIKPSSQKHFVVYVKFIQLGALLATLSVTIIGNLHVMSKTMPLLRGDMWRHHALALQYFKGFPIHAEKLIPDYPYFFDICIATFFQLSGLPSPIAYQALFILNFVAVLSFYSFIKLWCSKESVSSIVLLLIPLLGFGSLYAFNLKIQNVDANLSIIVLKALRKTYDIIDIMIISPVLSNVVPAIYIGFPTLFMFLYLLRKKMRSLEKIMLFALLVTVAYLGHVAEGFFMALILLLYASIMHDKKTTEGVIGGIIGLLIVLFVDSIAPAKWYVWSSEQFFSSKTMTFLATLILFVTSYVVLLFARSFHFDFTSICTFCRKLSSLISRIILYMYSFSLITWLYLIPRYDAIKWGHYDFTPFFVWPIRFGAIGFLFILCLTIYLKNIIKVKRLKFFLSLSLASFIFEQIANEFPFYPAYRFATLTLIGAIFMAAYFIVKSSSLIHNKIKKIVLITFILFIMLPSMLTTVLYYYQKGNRIVRLDKYEVDALNFLMKTLPSNASILTFTKDSADKLETFGGIHTLQVIYRWSYILLKTQDPSVLLYLLGTSNTKYIYVSPRDSIELKRAGIIKDFLKTLRIAFDNGKIKIYELPRLTPPSQNAKFIILNFLNYVDNINFTSSMLTLSLPVFLGFNYSIFSLPLNYKCENHKSLVIDDIASKRFCLSDELIHRIKDAILMLPYDPKFDVHELIDWTKKGGTLLVLSTIEELNFIGKTLGLRSVNQRIIAKEVVFKNINEKISIQHCDVREIIVTDSKTKVLAYYCGLDNETSPLLLCKELGDGKIFYVRFPTSILMDQIERGIATRIFSKIVKASDLSIQKSHFKFQYFPMYSTLERETTLSGLVKVSTEHIITTPMEVKHLVINKNEIEKKMSNVTILFESVGNLTLALNGSIKFLSKTATSYIVFSGNNAQKYHIKINNGILRIVILDRKKNYLMNNVSVIFEAPEFNALIRNPLINVDGKAIFESANIATRVNPPSYKHIPGTARGKMEIIGKIKFEVLYASEEVMLISNFNYKGEVKGSNVQFRQRRIIPWREVLSSPLHISILLIISLGSFLKKKAIVEKFRDMLHEEKQWITD